MPDHEWVTLVECHDVAELHALRAALESSGVPCRIQGEHTHGIMGAIHGSMVRSRVLVPQPGLAVARRIAADIVGPFEHDPPPPEDPADPQPFRRAAEPVADADDDDAPARPLAQRPKSYNRLILIAFLFIAPLLGLAHVYAGSNTRAGVLFVLSMLAIPMALRGESWALYMLAAIWLADILGGALAISAHNRRVAALSASPVRP